MLCGYDLDLTKLSLLLRDSKIPAELIHIHELENRVENDLG